MREARVGRREHGSADLDDAFVRRNCAARDFHERRLAGAVLSENGVNLAGSAIDAYVIKRPHAWVGLGYAFDPKDDVVHTECSGCKWMAGALAGHPSSC